MNMQRQDLVVDEEPPEQCSCPTQQEALEKIRTAKHLGADTVVAVRRSW